jgi:death-on-curing protein
VRYIELPEALIIAEMVTGFSADVLSRNPRVGLLDSALHAPSASFGGEEFYPDFEFKAAVLVSRIAKNHPLPDGNKRLAWMCLNMFCRLNGRELHATTREAVEMMFSVAGSGVEEADLAAWLGDRITAVTEQ